jgi:MFS family permease
VQRGPIAVLRELPLLRVFFLGQTISLIGAWMQQVAQSWVVATLTASTAAVATVSFVGSIPILALSMTGGVVADRHDRRRILIVTQLGFSAVAFLFAFLAFTGQLSLPWLYALAILMSTVLAFDLPAMQAFIPELVPPERIPDAIALNQTLMHGTRLVGPALAGALMAATSPAMAFVANGVSYFAVVVSLMVIEVPPRPAHERKAGKGGLREALAYVRAQPTVRALIGFTALSTAFVFPLFIVFGALFIKDVLGGREGDFGIFMSCSGAGAMTGALTLLRVRAEQRGRLILCATAIASALLFVQSFSRGVALAAAIQVLLTFSIALGMGLSSTIVQVVVLPRMRGRVMGLNGLAFTGIMPSAALLLGALGEHIGLRMVLRVCAVAYALLALPWLASAGLWRRTAHQPPETALPSAHG